MIIGSGFSKKNQHFLEQVAHLSNQKADKKISVKALNAQLKMDRSEIKNMLEYLENLGYLKIETIGGPLLYGHISITEKGLEKAREDGE